MPRICEKTSVCPATVGSTELKLFGEGQCKVRKHVCIKRRSGRKVHLGMDAVMGQVCAVLMTHKDMI